MQYTADGDQHNRQEKQGKRCALIPRIAVLRHALQLVLADSVHPVYLCADALLKLLVILLLLLCGSQMTLHGQTHLVNIFLLLPDSSCTQLLNLALPLRFFFQLHHFSDARIFYLNI